MCVSCTDKVTSQVVGGYGQPTLLRGYLQLVHESILLQSLAWMLKW